MSKKFYAGIDPSTQQTVRAFTSLAVVIGL